MSDMRSIEIDFDVHKLIETERTGFAETPNEVLRRLLNIDKKISSAIANDLDKQSRPAWQGKGVTLPHGTLARFRYNGRLYEASIHDGQWRANGKNHGSPSATACAMAETKGGKKTALNGWNLWEIKRPQDQDWKPLKSLRSR